jgi:sialidase-1
MLCVARLAAVYSLAAAASAAAAPAAPPLVPIFAAGDFGVPQYRIPALTVTGKGTLLAFAEARFQPEVDCGFKYLVARRSVDGGVTWGPPAVVAGGPANDTSAGNPQAVYHPQTGRVVVVYSLQHLPTPTGLCSPSDGVFVVDDGGSDGLAWGVPRNITDQLGPIAGHTVPGPGAGIVLTSASGPRAGRIVMSGTKSPYGVDISFYSDDGGTSWAPGTTTMAKMDESTLVELPDGRVVINMRNPHLNATCKCRAYAVSADSGVSFGPIAFDATLISPECEGSLLRVGDSVYFANPADTAQRANITIRRGTGLPGGWSPSTLLVLPGAAWGGYTSLAGPIGAGGASGGIVLEHWPTDTNVATISFTSFPLDF